MEGKTEKMLELSFDLNTIDHLGVQLYTRIPPMISELISNAWDADAHNVTIYFNDLDENNKEIIISDDGSGMTFDELNSCFLKIGRNRRIETHKSTTDGGRPVLGKKGLGKLSMFGIGKIITITTVKNRIKNEFEMNYDDIKNKESGTYNPKIIILDSDTEEKNGTKIKIGSINRKASFDIDKIADTISSRFTIFSEDFEVTIIHNNKDVKNVENNMIEERNAQFKWLFPDDYNDKISNKELIDFAIENDIKGIVLTSPTPLTNARRGITLFSRGKLVQEKEMFNERGNDNFYSYMSGVFHVDFVDKDDEIDNCSTDRKSLAWDKYDNESLEKLKLLIETIVNVTQNEWRKKRIEVKQNEIKSIGIDVTEWIESLNKSEQGLAKKITDAIIKNDDISSSTAKEYIGYVKDMYSFESFKNYTQELDELISLDNDKAIKLLLDWQIIEAKEFAKIASGRIKTIEQFDKYVKTNASENKVIQKFLEEFPWLLDSKMSKFEREVTYSRILKENFSDDSLPESNRRIDFLCTDNNGIIHVIELKRPNIKLTSKEIQQIAEYVEFIKSHYPQSVTKVKGYLISDNMTCELGAETIRKALETQDIYVKSYSDLLNEAKRYNKTFIDMYELIEAKKI